MFKVGSKYEFRMAEAGDEVTFWGTIETYEHPLIKLEDTQMPDINLVAQETGEVFRSIRGGDKVYPGQIINVTSPNFVSAVEKTD